MPPPPYNGHSMIGELLRVIVCPPRHAGWDRQETLAWRGLGFGRAPDFRVAEAQHNELSRLLTDAGAEVLCLPRSQPLTIDAVYTHDASLPTDSGVILMNPGKPNRVAEAGAQEEFCKS